MLLSAAAAIQPFVPGLMSLPDYFLENAKRAGSAFYLVSCAYGEKILYVSSGYAPLTGYDPRQFQEEGIRFWFSMIHPLDLPALTRTLSEAQLRLLAPGADLSRPEVLELEYRFRRADGAWVWLKESKWILAFTPDGIKDKILCLLEDVTVRKMREEEVIKSLLEREKSSHSLLKTALAYQENALNPPTEQASQSAGGPEPESRPALTRREKEVLGLIAGGLSTKEIAAKLFISDNTVETHRRHLLQKFAVRNSAELIGQASRLFRS